MPELLLLVLQILIIAVVLFAVLLVLTMFVAAVTVFISGTDWKDTDLDYDFED